jgi:tetratricopeptide (TPR) repeat protein
LLALAAIFVAPAAVAQAPTASASASATDTTEVPLPEIPPLPDTDVGAPNADALQDLQVRLDQLHQTHVSDPLEDVDFGFMLGELTPDHVPAIAARIQELRQQLDGSKAIRRLEAARKGGRRALRKIKKKDRPDGDWLVFLLAEADSDSDVWRDSVSLYGMLRMLEKIGTTPAVRQMVDSLSYFGELVRIDLQRAMLRLKDKAVPALLEAKQHDAKKVQRFARKHLDLLGRAIPGESVSTTDPQVLTDVLYAFGRIKDIEATRVVLSFTNSDRVQVRTAARAAIGALGEPATWHIKDTYKNLTGNKPPKSWDWKQTAREIFRIHDRTRLTQVFELWEKGTKALDEKNYAEATKAFDGVLARLPLFDERSKMAPAYFGRAEQQREEGDVEGALLSLRKALRLGPSDAEAKKIRARIALLEAKQLIAKGTPDRFLLQRAIELDPDDGEAQKLLDSLKHEAEERQVEQKKKVGGILALVLGIAVAILVLRRRDPDDADTGKKQPPPERREPESAPRPATDGPPGD